MRCAQPTPHLRIEAIRGHDAIGQINGKRVKTVEGARWTVQVKNGKVSILSNSGGTANVPKTDSEASNVVIHGIDDVLVPQSVVKKLPGSDVTGGAPAAGVGADV